MNKYYRLLNIVLFVIVNGVAVAQNGILRHYDPANADFLFPSGYQWIVARFEPSGAGKIQQINVKLGGTAANGSVEMAFMGHEGGTAFPQLEKTITPWITLNKTKTGAEWLTYAINDPIYTRNTQFFVVFRNFQNGARLYAENNPAIAVCKSSSGGDYYYIYTKSAANTWSIGSRKALAIDIGIDYDQKPSSPLFSDVTASLGIDTLMGNSSIAWADIDDDGYPELLTRTHLYQNVAGKNFRNLSAQMGYSPSVASLFIDINNDGKTDILSLFGSGDSGVWYKNMGNFQFEKNSCIGLKSLPSISSFSAADIDHDGYPDLFTGQLWGAYPEPLPNFLFKNHGNGTFSDITGKLYPKHNGLANFPDKVTCSAADQNTWISNGNTNKRSRGSAFADFDNDGDLDLYVTHYFLEPDEFFRNNGDGTFTDILSEKGIDKNAAGSNHGTGIDFGDYNNDGNLDILLPQFSHPAFGLRYDHRNTTIYRNNGGPDYSFTDLNQNNEMVNPASGISYEETYAGGSWGDVNNDGLLDFYITVFYGCRYVKLFVQNPDHTFSLKTFDYGLSKLNTGEDATWVDFNNDGKLDLCSGDNGRIRIFQNQDANTGHYITFDLRTDKGNSLAIGSKVIVYSNGRKITRFVHAGRGVRHQAPYRLYFGLGNASIEKVEVYWPNGQIETISGFLTNRHYNLSQGQPTAGLISQNTPLSIAGNPGSEISIRYLTDQKGKLTLSLVDVAGKTIEKLVELDIEPGLFEWPYTNPALAEGMYFIQAVFNEKKHGVKWIKISGN